MEGEWFIVGGEKSPKYETLLLCGKDFLKHTISLEVSFFEHLFPPMHQSVDRLRSEIDGGLTG